MANVRLIEGRKYKLVYHPTRYERLEFSGLLIEINPTSMGIHCLFIDETMRVTRDVLDYQIRTIELSED